MQYVKIRNLLYYPSFWLFMMDFGYSLENFLSILIHFTFYYFKANH